MAGALNVLVQCLGVVPVEQERPFYLWTCSQTMSCADGQQEREGFCPSALLSSHPTWSAASWSGAPTQKGHGPAGASYRCSEGWSSSPVQAGSESWDHSCWRRQLWGDLVAALQQLKGLQKSLKAIFTKGTGTRLRGLSCFTTERM